MILRAKTLSGPEALAIGTARAPADFGPLFGAQVALVRIDGSGLARFFDRYLWNALTDSGHQWILALALFLGGYFGCTSPLARYFLMVLRDNPVRLAISRIDSLSRPCQRRITLNKSTSITP